MAVLAEDEEIARQEATAPRTDISLYRPVLQNSRRLESVKISRIEEATAIIYKPIGS
jgi:hypothetical protein